MGGITPRTWWIRRGSAFFSILKTSVARSQRHPIQFPDATDDHHLTPPGILQPRWDVVGAQYSPTMLVDAARQAGFSDSITVADSGASQVVTVVAVALAESRGLNVPNDGIPAVQGVLQIHTDFHQCDAFNVLAAFQCAYGDPTLSNQGTVFHSTPGVPRWQAYDEGRWRNCRHIAEAAVNGVNLPLIGSGCPV